MTDTVTWKLYDGPVPLGTIKACPLVFGAQEIISLRDADLNAIDRLFEDHIPVSLIARSNDGFGHLQIKGVIHSITCPFAPNVEKICELEIYRADHPRLQPYKER